MRIIADFQWDAEWFGDLSAIREGLHFAYELRAEGATCPSELRVFYIGFTNNPIARLYEHTTKPHSGSLRAMMERAKEEEWEISMRIVYACATKERAKAEEEGLIRFYTRENSGFQLMNMEAMHEPVADWIEKRIEQAKEGQHDAHVLDFTRKSSG